MPWPAWNRYWLLAGIFFPGAQLAGRQPRRHSGPGTPAATSALRLLRGPHRRQLRRAGAHGRAGAVGVHASLHRDRPAGWRFCCFPSSPTWPPTRWENFNSRSGVSAPPSCAFCCPSATSRSLYHPMVFHGHYRLFDVGGAIGIGRHDGHADFLHRPQHTASLCGGANPMTHAWRSIAMRWLKFNLVGGIGIAVQLLAVVRAEDRVAFQLPDRHGVWRSRPP